MPPPLKPPWINPPLTVKPLNVTFAPLLIANTCLWLLPETMILPAASMVRAPWLVIVNAGKVVEVMVCTVLKAVGSNTIISSADVLLALVTAPAKEQSFGAAVQADKAALLLVVSTTKTVGSSNAPISTLPPVMREKPAPRWSVVKG